MGNWNKVFSLITLWLFSSKLLALEQKIYRMTVIFLDRHGSVSELYHIYSIHFSAILGSPNYQYLVTCRTPYNSIVGRELMKFLRMFVDHYNDVVQLLKLPHYGSVVNILDYRGRTNSAANVVQNMVDNVSAVF